MNGYQVLLFVVSAGIVALAVIIIRAKNNEEKEYEERQKPKPFPITVGEVSRLMMYTPEERDEYARYINTVPGMSIEQRWSEWQKTHEPSTIEVKIAGVNMHDNKRYVTHGGEMEEAVLVAEPTNPHDPNAIRIECKLNGHLLGYVPADQTDEIHEFVGDELQTKYCKFQIEVIDDDEDKYLVGKCIITRV